MRRRHSNIPQRVALLAVGACLLASAAFGAPTVPYGFVAERVVEEPFSGSPTGFAFLPDGRPLIVERNGGGVRVAAVGSSHSFLIATIPNVVFDGERGLVGVDVDPSWPARPYLYFFYSRADGKNVVEMRTASGDLTNPSSTSVTLASPYVLLEIPDTSPIHNSGTLRFGPDTMLYVSVGDDEFRCDAQDLTSLGGSILRLDVSAMPGAGTGPPAKSEITPDDNPFLTHPDEDARLVWAWGFRNPFRFDIDAPSGDLFIGDVGYLAWEEIDHLPFSSGGGQNYGWPLLEGGSGPPFGDTCGQGNVLTSPVYTYLHVAGIYAVIGGPLYRATISSAVSLPPSYDGSYFFADWGQQWLRRLVQSRGAWQLAPPVAGQPSPENWAQGLGAVTDLQTGPDGALWFAVQVGERGLWRIARSLPTDVVDLGVSAHTVRAVPNPARAGEPVRFHGSDERTSIAQLEIADVMGRRIASFQSDAAPGVFVWDGLVLGGVPAPSGVYFFRTTSSSGESAAGRVTILR